MILTKREQSQLNAAAAARAAMYAKGYTGSGDKLWSTSEDEVLIGSPSLTLQEVQKLLPHRTTAAIDHRRAKLSLSRRQLRAWTTLEDRKLRENIESFSYVGLSKLLPGRSPAAIQGRAWYLGFRKGQHPQRLATTGIDLVDQIRQRAREDGLTLKALDGELGSGKYFRNVGYKRGLNMKIVARAVDYFGGKLAIDWRDF